MASDPLSPTFAALADPTRRAILARLASGPATVKELSAPFAMSGPAVSKHLRVLERAGLITRGRDAQFRPEQFEMTGVYREVKAPERLVNTEAWGAEWPETVNTVVFTEKGGKTTVTTTVLYASKEVRDGAIKTGMESGWDRSYERLYDYLHTVAR